MLKLFKPFPAEAAWPIEARLVLFDPAELAAVSGFLQAIDSKDAVFETGSCPLATARMPNLVGNRPRMPLG